jgi:isopenicillin N synthase-like dioxygenase
LKCDISIQSQLWKLDIHKSSNFKGYTPLLGENTNPDNQGDLHEGFDIGWESDVSNTSLTASITRSANDAMVGENVWPDNTILPGFRAAVLAY